MSERPKGYGLTAEVSNRINSKYVEEDEARCLSWITAITGASCPASGRENVHAWLKDGKVLIQLMNTLRPGAIPKHNANAGMAFKAMENISLFLAAAETYGVSKQESFQTVDLYEATNMAQVLTTIIALSAASHKNNFQGPIIGPKVADENKRDLDEAKLREGRSVIGLQMGTNQVASQKGMTAYGLGRQVAPGTK